MAILKIEVNDRYVKRFIEFLRLMPKEVVKIEYEDSFEKEIEKELLKREEELKQKKVRLLKEEEIFDDL